MNEMTCLTSLYNLGMTVFPTPLKALPPPPVSASVWLTCLSALRLYETCIYEPTLPFSWNTSTLVDPVKIQRSKLPPALPPTKSMQDKAIKKDDGFAN